MYTGVSFLFWGVIVNLQWGKLMAGCFDVPIADICNIRTQDVPYMSSRDPSTTLTNETLQRKYCDLFAMEKQQWYRSEITMTTTCPEMYKCGAKFPIWMNGSQPQPDEGIVNRIACLRDFENCCLIKYRLAAVNCGQYLAYCLLELPSGCPQRYCFDRQMDVSSSGAWTSAIWSRKVPVYSMTTLSPEPETTSHVINVIVQETIVNKELIIILTVVFVLAAVAILVFLQCRRPAFLSRRLKTEDEVASSTKKTQNNKYELQTVSVIGGEKADYGISDIDEMHNTCFDVDTGVLNRQSKTEYSTLHLYETIPEIDKGNSTHTDYQNIQIC